MADPVVYPLYWPDSQPRTKESERINFPSSTNWTVMSVWREFYYEVERLTKFPWIFSSSAEWSTREGRPKSYDPNDTGAALWFKRKKDGPWLCIACDKFNTLGGNIRAIQLIIEGRRREERYGTTAMIESAWSAFEVKALPVAYEPWHIILEVAPDCPLEVAEAAYRALARKAHPDAGGTDFAMSRLNVAIDNARQDKSTQEAK